MKSISRVLWVLFLLIAASSHAADTETLITDCNDCHGQDGLSTDSDIPIIAGQAYVVLEDALNAYAAKERICIESKYRHGNTERPATTMCDVAANLGAEEIEALSEHYESLPFKGVVQDFDAALAKTGAKIHQRNCDKCHSEGGSLADDEAGLLAGQWTEYLRASIEDYQSGDRPMTKKMAEKMRRMSTEDFEALLHFYASQVQ